MANVGVAGRFGPSAARGSVGRGVAPGLACGQPVPPSLALAVGFRHAPALQPEQIAHQQQHDQGDEHHQRRVSLREKRSHETRLPLGR